MADDAHTGQGSCGIDAEQQVDLPTISAGGGKQGDGRHLSPLTGAKEVHRRAVQGQRQLLLARQLIVGLIRQHLGQQPLGILLLALGDEGGCQGGAQGHGTTDQQGKTAEQGTEECGALTQRQWGCRHACSSRSGRP